MILISALLFLAQADSPQATRRAVLPTQPEQEERFLRVYDVEDLRLPGSVPPEIRECLRKAELDASLIEEIEAMIERERFHREFVDLLRTWVPLGDEAQLDMKSGTFVANLTQAEHGRVEEFLTVQRSAAPYFQLDFTLYSLPADSLPDDLEERDASSGSEVLDGDALVRFFGQVRVGPQTDQLMAPSVACLARQSSSISSLNQIAYVADFEVVTDPATGAATADPVVKIIQDGVRLQARPVPLLDDRIGLELDLEVSAVTRPIATFETTVLESEQTVTIQLPETVITRFDSDLSLDSPGSFVLDIGLQGNRRLYLQGSVEPKFELR